MTTGETTPLLARVWRPRCIHPMLGPAQGVLDSRDGRNRREGRQAEEVTVNRVSWKQVGMIREPGRYKLRFGWVTVTAVDLEVWSLFPEATFALLGEGNEEYRLGSVDLNGPAPLACRTRWCVEPSTAPAYVTRGAQVGIGL
jgi:hypothetical protein